MFGDLLPFSVVRIVGPSMEPELCNGDLWLMRKGSQQVEKGRVVAFYLPERPHLMQVKRLIRRQEAGWWVEGDNRDHSTDSRDYGAVPAECIKGVLVWKISSRST